MRSLIAMAACLWALAAPSAQAEIDGHGPDAWRVTGVAGDDVLNMRMGPGTRYLVIDSLAPTARGLEQITCVPLLTPMIRHKLTDAQRADLPQRWCLMRTSDFRKAGWVAQRFITEDTGAGADVMPAVRTIGDPLIDGAAFVVRALYVTAARSHGPADHPFTPANGGQYFVADIVPHLSGHGDDVLYGAQDFQGRITRIAPDGDRPMMRGMITIHVDFVNFGANGRVTYRLCADTSQPGAPLRIFRIEHADWTFPD